MLDCVGYARIVLISACFGGSACEEVAKIDSSKKLLNSLVNRQIYVLYSSVNRRIYWAPALGLRPNTFIGDMIQASAMSPMNVFYVRWYRQIYGVTFVGHIFIDRFVGLNRRTFSCFYSEWYSWIISRLLKCCRYLGIIVNLGFCGHLYEFNVVSTYSYNIKI
jgi:hypothetical protein